MNKVLSLIARNEYTEAEKIAKGSLLQFIKLELKYVGMNWSFIFQKPLLEQYSELKVEDEVLLQIIRFRKMVIELILKWKKVVDFKSLRLLFQSKVPRINFDALDLICMEYSKKLQHETKIVKCILNLESKIYEHSLPECLTLLFKARESLQFFPEEGIFLFWKRQINHYIQKTSLFFPIELKNNKFEELISCFLKSQRDCRFFILKKTMEYIVIYPKNHFDFDFSEYGTIKLGYMQPYDGKYIAHVDEGLYFVVEYKQRVNERIPLKFILSLRSMLII